MIYSLDTYIAANKFGLGLRPGEAPYIEQDPRGWLLNQLADITSVPARLSALPTSASYLASLSEDRMMMQATRQDNNAASIRETALRESRRDMSQDYQTHLQLRLQTAVETEAPFAERLLYFWSNHFSVAYSGGQKSVIRQLALPFEQEAIRANLDGDFASLLLAVEQHPAMLIYLDNSVSTGPNSLIGKRRNRGLNENLAREILELHTLGVNGGYSQDDITSLAKIITGWTIPDQRITGLPGVRIDNTTGFFYVPQLHEPGNHRVLGKTYSGQTNGLAQGEQVLNDLARHPATARHLAEKLARHFISDTPSELAIRQLENTFLDTGGHLPSLHEALVNLDEAWLPENSKLRTPQELIIATARGMELESAIESNKRVSGLFTRILTSFNQMPFTALSPAGWEDSTSYWASPDALMKRMEWANSIANLTSRNRDAEYLAEEILLPDAHLKQALANTESSHQAITVLLASPAFQWRS